MIGVAFHLNKENFLCLEQSVRTSTPFSVGLALALSCFKQLCFLVFVLLDVRDFMKLSNHQVASIISNVYVISNFCAVSFCAVSFLGSFNPSLLFAFESRCLTFQHKLVQGPPFVKIL